MATNERVDPDMGISDVLDSTQRLELQNDSPQPVLLQQSSITVNESASEEEPNGYEDSLDKFEETGFDKVSENNDIQASGEPFGHSNFDNSNPEIDFSDPDQVVHMLETVDLTEDDTEVLLQEAYKMNRKLKEMLRRQEMPEETSKKKTSKGKVKDSGHSMSSGSSSGNGSRSGSAFSVRKPLPPIVGEKNSNVYAIKLRRSQTNIPESSKSVTVAAVQRSRSSKESAPGTKKTKSKPEPKAEWNNRFNYT